MTTFAEKEVVYSDGQINVLPLPEAIMANGFIPETRDAPGMPLAAQHLNWLFRDLYRQASQLKQNADKNPALPAWAPIACPLQDVPEGYLKCNGAAFDREKYPELAKGYPNGTLPDLRGEFIRGWDDGRGVDKQREVLSFQGDAIRNIYGTLGELNDRCYRTTGAFSTTPFGGGSAGLVNGLVGLQATFDASLVVPTAEEVRPRNVAFLYIVRAA